jgi:hypothetical protein
LKSASRALVAPAPPQLGVPHQQGAGRQHECAGLAIEQQRLTRLQEQACPVPHGDRHMRDVAIRCLLEQLAEPGPLRRLSHHGEARDAAFDHQHFRPRLRLPQRHVIVGARLQRQLAQHQVDGHQADLRRAQRRPVGVRRGTRFGPQSERGSSRQHVGG